MLNKYRILLLIGSALLHLASGFAQGSSLPLGSESYHIIDRLSIKTGLYAPFHTNARPHPRSAVTRLAMQADTADVELSDLDRKDLEYIFRDNNEWLGMASFATTLGGRKERAWPDTALTQVECSLLDARYARCRKPILGFAYPTPANLIEVNDKYFHLRANPMLNLQYAPLSNEEQPVFINQRGLELRAGVDDRIYFYANIVESQAALPQYVTQRVNRDIALPGAALYKPYNSNVFNIQNGYDFLNGQGVLGFNISRHVGAQLGYGRHFIGNGYRSMLLSDFAQNYPFLRLNWNVWKFHYQNLYAELDIRSANQTRDGTLVSKKYMAAHHLSINLGKNVNIGVFETVIFARPNHFALHYLNPVILYRAVEQATGSPDNVLIGLDGRWNIARRFQLYGQFIFDEFVFRELVLENKGWWANKYGIQAGLKYVDVLGIDHLDVQAELNFSRPYNYTHRDSTGSYAHHNQALAHPLGANFKEAVFIARYRPIPRLFVEARLIRANIGEDAPGQNWGNNILFNHDTRVQEYGNNTGQGIAADVTLAGLDISFMAAHNVFFDVQYFYRNKTSEDPLRNNRVQYIGGGIRVNMAKLRMDF